MVAEDERVVQQVRTNLLAIGMSSTAVAYFVEHAFSEPDCFRTILAKAVRSVPPFSRVIPLKKKALFEIDVVT